VKPWWRNWPRETEDEPEDSQAAGSIEAAGSGEKVGTGGSEAVVQLRSEDSGK
jgi:hypothetical protein